MRTIRTKVYQFNELSAEAQQKVISDFRNTNETDLYGFIDDCQEQLKEAGFNNAELRYSLSYSQGDGLSFNADIDLPKLLRAFKPDIKDSVYNVLVDNTYCSCEANNGHYAYARKSDVSVTFDDNLDYPNIVSLVEEFEEYVQDLYMEWCDKLVNYGYADLEYQESDEYIVETIQSNEYEYTKEGKQF